MKLLVVEDEEDIARPIILGLRKKGYALDWAKDGEEALYFSEVNSYDLVILDLNLPKIDGMTVLKQLRKTDLETKVLILSARWSVEDKVTGLDLGANDYLVKPFHFAELEARVRALLNRKFIQEPVVLALGTLRLDCLNRKCCIDEQPVELTGRELAIVEYLLKNQERAVSAEELIEHIWDSEADLFSNAIKVHISTLRKKLSDSCVITHIRGSGYRIEPKEASRV